MFARPSRDRWIVAAWGGFFGVMIAFFITAFMPRPFESSMKIQLNEPPGWLLTPGLSGRQLMEGLRSEAVLLKTEGSLLRDMVSVEAVPGTFLFKVTVRQSNGGKEDEIVTSLVKNFDDVFTEEFKRQAKLNLAADFDAKKPARDRMEEVESEILRIMPEYFSRPSTDCGTVSDPEFQKFSARLKAYDGKKSMLEQTNPRFVSLVKQHGELAVAAAAVDPMRWTIIPIPYTSVRVIEEASPPVRSSLPNLMAILAGGFGIGFLMFLLFGGALLSWLGRGKSWRSAGSGTAW